MPVLKVKNNGIWEEVIGGSSSESINGGNADTLDGKHADEFALVDDVSDLQVKVGDTAVSEQIISAVNDITLSKFGITATAAELNKLDGITATTKELNYIDGVTSNIQVQLDNKATSTHTHDYLPLAGGSLTGNIIIPNGKGYKQKDTNGDEYSLIFLSASNKLQIGWNLPNTYPIQLNNMLVLTSDLYGDSLPSAGQSGRIFFKKV